jgi:hypothetical protein
VYWNNYVSLQELENSWQGQEHAKSDTSLSGNDNSGPSDSSPYALKPEQTLDLSCYSRAEMCTVIKDDGVLSRKKRQPTRHRISAFKVWMQTHGPTSYPSKKQLKELAFAEGKTTKQARIALNNLRSRAKQGKATVYRKICNSHANVYQTQAGTMLIYWAI